MRTGGSPKAQYRPAPHPPATHLRCVAGAVCGAPQAVSPRRAAGSRGPNGVQVCGSGQVSRCLP